MAQVQDSTTVGYDTVFLQKDYILTISDSALYAKKDTVFILPDSLEYMISATPSEKTKQFYKSLKSKFYQTKLTRELYDLIFTDPPTSTPKKMPVETKKSVDPYLAYEGKVIGNIRIKKLSVFGTSIEDTTRQIDSWIVRTGNKLHANTRRFVLRKNLLVKKGDKLDPLTLADNERIIRELSYIQDARILVSPRGPNSDTVDLVLVTKDIWSISANIRPNGFTSGNLRIDDRNILGFGHELNNYVVLSPDKSQTWGYDGTYKVPNIFGTFITSEINYANTFRKKVYSAKLYRNFITPATKYAGGIELSKQQLRKEIIQEDSTLLQFPFTFNLQDFWLGRAFALNRTDDKRSQITFSGRYTRKVFTERPVVTSDSNREYHSNYLLLGSVGFNNRAYYKGRYIYGFGRTEDIPVGSLAELTGGVEVGEFYNRYYTGIRLAKGKFFEDKGYFYGEANVGGFLKNGAYEQGVFNIKSNMFSNLYHFKTMTFRQFVQVEYTRGIRRFDDEFITINNERGIRGLRSTFLRGTKKLTLNLETLLFTPFNPIGFQFAFFVYGDLAIISFDKSVFQGDTYTGFGLGLRIRNDNLTFNTFQIRLGFFPKVPIDASQFDLNISGTTSLKQKNFETASPSAILFQ